MPTIRVRPRHPITGSPMVGERVTVRYTQIVFGADESTIGRSSYLNTNAQGFADFLLDSSASTNPANAQVRFTWNGVSGLLATVPATEGPNVDGTVHYWELEQVIDAGQLTPVAVVAGVQSVTGTSVNNTDPRNPVITGGGGAASLTPTAVKTANYTAAVSDLVPVDTTSGSVTVTLPTAPADKAQVGVKHVIRGGTNTVTLAAGGSDVFNKAGGSTTLTLTLLNQAAVVQYKAAGAIWYVVSDDLSLAQLDLRFDAAGAAIAAQAAAIAAAGSADTVTTVATSGASQTITVPASGSMSEVLTLTANCTLTFNTTAAPAGKAWQITLELVQDSTGSRTVTWPATVVWPANSAPTLTVTAAHRDIVSLVSLDNGATWQGALAGADYPTPALPVAPTLSVTAGNTTAVLTIGLTVSAPATTAVKVYRGTTAGGEVLVATLGAVSTYTDTGLTNGTTYYWKVSAVNALGEGPQSTERSATPAGGGLPVTDSFNRTDSSSSLGSTDTGQAWTAAEGTWGINTNQAYNPSNDAEALAVLDTAATDISVTAKIYGLASGAAFGGLVARYVDANNYYLVQYGSSTGVQLFKKAGGTFTQLGTNQAISYTSGDTFFITVKGTAISCGHSGTTLISVTDSSLTTGTKAGLRKGDTSGTGVRWDDLSIIAAP